MQNEQPPSNMLPTDQIPLGSVLNLIIETTYEVLHYKMNETGTAYYEPEVEVVDGIAGEMTTASAKPYTGFTPESFEQVEIKADGSSFVEIYYTRNQYTLEFDANGGTGGTTTQEYYDAPISAPTVTRSGYQFNAWSPEVPEKMPAQDLTCTATWEKIPTATIVYSGANRQATSATSYTQTLTGTAGATTVTGTINNTYFRSLYGIAAFKGWTTTKSTSSTVAVTHNGGASVTLNDGATLTLYPVYTPTDKAINYGQTTDAKIATTAGGSNATANKTYTVTMSSYASGYKAGDPYQLTVYGYLDNHNNSTSNVYYSKDSTTVSTSVVSKTGTGTANATKTVSGTNAAPVIRFRITLNSGSGARTSYYKCYISKITIW